jgi:hypothetical protein
VAVPPPWGWQVIPDDDSDGGKGFLTIVLVVAVLASVLGPVCGPVAEKGVDLVFESVPRWLASDGKGACK